MTEYAVDVKKVGTIREYLYRPDTVKQLNHVLPKFMNADRFLRTFYTAILRNPALQECSIQSMLSAMIDCAALGLEPIMGRAALVPYGNQVQFQPMYRGLIELARRTGNIVISAHNVHQNDMFDIEFGDNEHITHKPVFTNRGDIIGAYTVWTFPDGMKSKTFMPIEDIHAIRARSKAWVRAQKNPKDDRAQQTPWVTDPGEMNIKTVIKRHSKLQPMTIEMDWAVQHDDHVEYGALPPLRSALMPELPGAEGLPQVELTTTGADPFSESIPKGTDPDKLEKYLQMCAESFGHKSVEDFKSELIRSNEIGSFWKSFVEFATPVKRGRKPATPKVADATPNIAHEPPPPMVDFETGEIAEPKEPSFLEEAGRYRELLAVSTWDAILNLYQIKDKDLGIAALAPGYHQAFLARCKAQLDLQNSKK